MMIETEFIRRGAVIWIWRGRAAAALLVVAILSLWGWQAWQNRQRELTNAEVLVTSLSRALESQIDSSMRGIEFLLDEAADRISPEAWPNPAQQEWFRARLTGLPEISAIIVADANGQVIGPTISRGTPRPPQGKTNIADRAYFIEMKAQFPATKLMIGAPLPSRFSDRLSIPIVRALTRPDGSFGGVLVAGLLPSSLKDKLDAVLVDEEGGAAIFRSGAMYLARSPDNDKFVGLSIPHSILIRDHISLNRTGIAYYTATSDGQEKIAAYRSLERYPLTGVVTVNKSNALAHWNRMMLVEGLAMGILSVALLAVAMLFDRRAEATLRLTEQLAASHANLERQVEDRTAHLAAANLELEHFAYAASHDLQEPLRNVTGFLQLLSRRYQGALDAQADEYIDFAVKAAKQMSALITDVLAYSRNGKNDGAMETAEATALARAAEAGLADAIAASGTVVEIDPLPRLLCLPSQIKRLFENLISNSVKFHAPERPNRIQVGSRPSDQPGMVEFWVADNGIGIESQYLERIFGLFQRLHPRERFEGTGIGLALCRKIVERHKGRIWAESIPGEGTTVRFTLPLAP